MGSSSMQRHPRLVQEFLEQSAERCPFEVALVCGSERLTYGDIEEKANRLARALMELGVRRGDRVGLHLPNSVEAVAGIFGVLKAGGVFVVINPTTKLDKLQYILNNCMAKAVVTDMQGAGEDFVKRFSDAVPSLIGWIGVGKGGIDGVYGSIRALRYSSVEETFSADRPGHENVDLDLACLIYTSGTTGAPKGVMSDHSNVVFASGSIIEYLENVELDVVINVLPLSFDYGLYQLLMTFRFGGTLVLERSFAYPAAILKKMEQERVTGFPGVPTMFSMLLPMDLTSFDLSNLRYVTNTAAALPVSHIEALRKKFPWTRLYSMYGLTETKRSLYLPPEELDRRPGSVGIPIPGTEAWLEDSAGNRLGPDETGELVIRGRHVMRGYWMAPEATAHRFRDNSVSGERLCYTGDLFRMDEGGFFYFVGRQDDIIKSRGEKVAPREVENVLYALPGVRDAAVVGVSDPLLGQAIKAFIVCTEQGSPTEKEVLAHCRSNLEDYMVPKWIEFREKLPKSENGKIQKTDIF